jgi:single-stranded-DNA-specific exonuclease
LWDVLRGWVMMSFALLHARRHVCPSRKRQRRLLLEVAVADASGSDGRNCFSLERALAKIWRLLPHEPDALSRLAADLGVAPVVAQLLYNRGLRDAAAARRFLDAPLTDLHPPASLPGAAAAADRLWAAARERRKITVYGDYDVDGVTGTAILFQALTLLGADVDFYVPNRLDEGYGLNIDALRQLAAGGTKVVVTVDCGICSCAEADEARRLGLELIVTDHHEHLAELPCADVLVHPRLPGHEYPFGGLSGAGVAFKVAWLTCQRAEGSDKVSPRLKQFLLDAVALAAMGLVADVVPLHDENRVYVRHGLHRLRAAPTVGLKALLETAGLSEAKSIRAEDVAYKLAPRLNAAGRLGCARLVVELLTSPSPHRAREIATYLESQNQQRQQIERKIAAQAREMVRDGPYRDDPALVLASADWHPGVIGIVAGRLAEQLGRPVLLVALRDDGAGSGSGRSVVGFALHQALAHCTEHLLSHGGHAAAAGFRIHADRLGPFREQFCAYAARQFPNGPTTRTLTLDAEVPLSALTPGLLSQIDRLEPYGAQNPRPTFLVADVEIVGEPRRIGGGERHLTFRVRQGSTGMRAVAWSMAERMEELMSGDRRCCVAATPKINEWNGYRSVELEVIDFRAGAVAGLT